MGDDTLIFLERMNHGVLLAFIFLLSGQAVFAAGSVETGLQNAGGGIFQGQLEDIVGFIIFTGLGTLGFVFLALIVYGGVLWMTSMGDEKKITTARTYLFHSILGLIITLGSYAITRFVIGMLGTSALR
ncbi:MAG: hypothetical protein AAB416_00535 [Patescibacteria group bacterium]